MYIPKIRAHLFMHPGCKADTLERQVEMSIVIMWSFHIRWPLCSMPMYLPCLHIPPEPSCESIPMP